MIEPNDRTVKEAHARSRRRKSAGWKSGLMLTGLGAVVLGAGYLAGVNAPAVAQAGTAQAPAQGTTPQAVARSGEAAANEAENRVRAPENNQAAESERESEGSSGSDARLFLGYDENGNAVYLGPDGSLVMGSNDGTGSQNQAQPQQQFGRRNRQFGGLSQQRPNFGRPLTRSRGS